MDEIDTSRLGSKLKAELEKNGLLSCRKIMITDTNEFRKLGNFTDDEILEIKTVASQMILKPVTANAASLVYKEKWRNITFDCEPIDRITGGGVPTRGITEIYGESGAGKTQLCLQLSIAVQYPKEFGGLNRGAIYICTEDRFPAKRLQQMVIHFPKKDLEINRLTDRIWVDHIPDVDGLKECLFKRLPHVLKTSTIGLVVIDSIAAIFRADYTPKEYNARAKDMRAIAIQLHNLARSYNIAVVCVNQVAEAVEIEETVPALGLVWANLVTTKFQASIENEARKFKVVSAPHLPPAECTYQITIRGIEGM